MAQLQQPCAHAKVVEVPKPAAGDCQECGERFSNRLCLTCGHVGCCDSSAKHARIHWKESGHPVMKAMPADAKTWFWCYECNAYIA